MSSAGPHSNEHAGSYREDFAIDADHPSLPGHFPDRPVVPGVVLLERAAAALQRWRGLRIAALPVVKFAAPILPRQAATLILHDAASASWQVGQSEVAAAETARRGRYRFEILSAGQLAASGTIETVPAA